MASSISTIKRLSIKGYVLLFIFLFIGVLISINSCKDIDDSDTYYLNHADDVKYVGIETCAECHQDKHSTFIHTGMGLSFDSATRQKSSAKFGMDHVVYDSVLDLSYYPFWEDDSLFVKEFRIAEGDTTHQLSKRINYIVGSGQHTNSHLIFENGYFLQAPITFYVQDDKWDLAPGFEKGNNSRFSRILNDECISCHNSMPKMADNSNFKFTEVGKGIDCERCHGPGELHVELMQTSAENHEEMIGVDRTIVNPRDLSWERQIDLCQRCHLQGLNLLKPNKNFTDFKPGMKLSDVFDIYLPEYEGGVSPFDMANHSDRFQKSKCFTEGNKQSLEFTCITCHNPHISVKMMDESVYNAACNGCHQVNKCTESRSERNKVEDDCVSCHMLQNGAEDIPHVSVHDHKIAIPMKKEDIKERGDLVGLYAVNNPNPSLENKILSYLEYWEKFDKNPFYLNQAKELLIDTENKELWLKFYYLIEKYQEAIDLGLDERELSTWNLVMLAKSYEEVNQNTPSLYLFRRAYESDKTNVQIAKELLSSLIKNGELREAEILANALLMEFPSYGVFYSQLAKVYLLKGNVKKCGELLKIANKLEPDNLNVWLVNFNYAIRLADRVEVKKWSDLIIKKDPTRLSYQKVTDILESM